MAHHFVPNLIRKIIDSINFQKICFNAKLENTLFHQVQAHSWHCMGNHGHHDQYNHMSSEVLRKTTVIYYSPRLYPEPETV